MSAYHKQHGLNGRRWARLRWAVLKRDAWTCQLCGKAGAYRLEIDHIQPLHVAPALAWDMSNLQTLCAFPCHSRKTAAENGADLERLDRRRAERAAWDELVSERQA